MLPHRDNSRHESPKVWLAGFFLKLNSLQNYGLINLQNHGLSDKSSRLQQLLEQVHEPVQREKATAPVAKHEIVIFPRRTGFQTCLELTGAVLLQRLNHEMRQDNLSSPLRRLWFRFNKSMSRQVHN